MSLAGIIMPCVWSGIFTFILFNLETTGLRKYQLAIVGIANIIVIPWIIIAMDVRFIVKISDTAARYYYIAIGVLLFAAVVAVIFRNIRMETHTNSNEKGRKR